MPKRTLKPKIGWTQTEGRVSQPAGRKTKNGTKGKAVSMTDTANNNLASPCGLYCGECLYYQKECQGCVPSGGQPSWGKCRTYACSVEKKVEHCGECAEFPCSRLLKQYSRALGPWRAFYKTGQLVYRKKIGTAAWVKEKEAGKNPDPKVAVERHLLWEKEQNRKLKSKRQDSKSKRSVK